MWQALRANPNDLAALEALAVTEAKLFQFEKAADLLQKLTTARPNDAEVRLE